MSEELPPDLGPPQEIKQAIMDAEQVEDHHRALSPLPILERMEAEIAENELAAYRDEHDDFELECSQVPRPVPSPVHLPADELEVGSNVVVNASGSDHAGYTESDSPVKSAERKPGKPRTLVKNPTHAKKPPVPRKSKPRESASHKADHINSFLHIPTFPA